MRSNNHNPTNQDYKQVIYKRKKYLRFQQDQNNTNLLDKLFIKGYYEEK